MAADGEHWCLALGREGVVNGFERGFARKSTGLADESDDRGEEEEIGMTGWCHFLESRSLREKLA